MNACNKISIKLCKQSMVQINATVAFSTKRVTHYETLGVSPNATHNEIKSAYYKLTFEYHPDRNKSESAKRKFQDVSDAYNVVGNYQSRKRYDRTIAIKHRKETIVYKSVYRSTNAASENTSLHKVYDFDEWTRQHYSNAFRNDMRKKEKHMMSDRLRYTNDSVSNKTLSQFMAAGICVIFCFYWFCFREDYDTVKDRKKDS